MADTPRFSVYGNQILDTSTGKALTPNEFNQRSTPQERDAIERELTARSQMVNQESEDQIDEAAIDETLAPGADPAPNGSMSTRPPEAAGPAPTPAQPEPTSPEPAPSRPAGVPPSLEEFLAAAKPENPQFDDREIAIEYRKLYPDANKFYPPPPVDAWVAKAKEANPGFDEAELKSYYTDIYGKPDEPLGFGGTLLEGAKSAGRSLKAFGQAALGYNEEAAQTAKDQLGAPKDPALAQLLETIATRKAELGPDASWWEVGKSVGKSMWENPKGAGLLMTEQLPNSAVALGSAATGAAIGAASPVPGGAVIGGLLGLFGANVGLETGQKVIEKAADGSLTPEERSQALSEGVKKGAVVSAVDAATFGMTKWLTGTANRAMEAATARVLTEEGIDVADRAAVQAASKNPAIRQKVAEAQERAKSAVNTLGQRAARVGAEAGLETLGEGVGEYLGEVAATGQGDKTEAIIEALAGFGQSAAEVGVASALSRKESPSVGAPAPPVEPPTSPAETVAPILAAESVDQAIGEATKLVETPPISAQQLDQVIGATPSVASTYTDSHLNADQAAFERLMTASGIPLDRSAEGVPTADGAPLKVIDPRTLPVTTAPDAGISQEKLDALSVIAQAFGKRIVVFQAGGTLPNGAFWQKQDPSRIYLASETTNEDANRVLMHEAMHTMQGTAFYEAYKQTIVRNLTPSALAVARARHNSKKRTLTEAQLVEEMGADIGSDQMQKPEMWEKVFQVLRDKVGDEQAKVEVVGFIDSLKQIIQRIKSMIATRQITASDGKTLTELYVSNLEKVQDALAEAVGNTLYNKKYATPEQTKAVGKLALSKKVQSDRTLLPKDVAETFSTVASLQREKPEAAMLAVQKATGGGLLSHAVEHTGDLIHRMSEGAKHGTSGKEYVKEKVDRVLTSLTHAYGFEKEHAENLANNRADQQAVNAALKQYVAEHKALPVYNRAQWLARAAAVAVGEMRIKDAVAHLKALKQMVDSTDFSKEAFAFRRGADQKIQPYLQPVPGKLIGRQILNSKKIPDFDLYDLDVDLPGHPAGSTVTQETMAEEGYRIVPSDLISAKESKEAKQKAAKEKVASAKKKPEQKVESTVESKPTSKVESKVSPKPMLAPNTSADKLARVLPTTTSPKLTKFLLPDGTRLTWMKDRPIYAHFTLAEHAGVRLDEAIREGVIRYAWPNYGIEIGKALTTKQAETIVDDWAITESPLTIDIKDNLGSVVVSHDFDVLGQEITPSFLQDWVKFNLEKGDTPRFNPNGTAKLVHYSKEKDLAVIDPKYHGTGQIGAERLRQMNEGKAYTPRSFFYRAGAKIEPRFKGMTKYQVEVPESSLVDLATLKGTPTERERAAKKAGYKGYYNSESSMPNVVAMFESVPTMSGRAAAATVGDLRSDPLFSPRTWVSQIEKVLEQKMPKSASAAQVKGILSPQNGIKADELQEMGIDEYLASKTTFDKANVLEWVKAHQIQAENVTFEKRTRTLSPREIQGIEQKYAREIEYREDNLKDDRKSLEAYENGSEEDPQGTIRRMLETRVADSTLALVRAKLARDEELNRRSIEEDTTKYASWQLPGGANYKEVFVTLPPATPLMVKLTDWRVQKVYGEDYTFWEVSADRPNGTVFTSNVDIEEYPTEAEAILVAQSVAKRHESNWGGRWTQQPNEAESDRAGYPVHDVMDPTGRVRATLPSDEAAEYMIREQTRASQQWRDGHESYDDVINPIVRLRMNDRTTADGQKILFLEEVQPPNPSNQAKMPKWALKRWREIGLKQALRLAAEGDYDAIGWTTGAQQADRYSLRKQIERLTVLLGDKRPDGSFEYEIRAYTHDNNLIKETATKDTLPDVIGEELAARAIAEVPKSDFAQVTYKDADLAMGGEGLMKVYDKDLVNAANGLAKKWGVQVQTGKIPVGGQYSDERVLPFEEWMEDSYPNVDTSTMNLQPYRDTYQLYVREQTRALDRKGFGEKSVHALPVTDAMKTVAKEGQPLFAPSRAPRRSVPAPRFQVDQPGTLDKIIRVLQDKAIDIKRIVESVQKAGLTVPDELNPILKEEMYMKRAEQRASDFTNDELRPLVKAMQLSKVTLEQLDTYLQARHIIRDRVNHHLQQINPDLQGTPQYDKLAGMTDAEARAILAKVDPKIMEPLAKRVDKMVEKTRDLMVAYGLEKQSTIDQWRQFYTAYVPLHREGFEEDGHPTGTGRSVRGSTVKGRTGSDLGVTNILANVAQARDQIITRGEKQRPVIAMAGLMMLYPNPEIATLDKPTQIQRTDPATGLITTVPWNLTNYTVPTVRRYDPVDGVVKTYPDPMYKGRDNVVNFRIDGQDYAIVFNERNERAMEAAKAFKELDTAKLNGITAAIAPYTRYLASINTQYNPIFGIVNFVRDAQFAMLALGSTPLAGQKIDVLKNALGALKGIYQDARAVRLGQHPSSATAQMWERFQHVGGPTGYRDLFFSSTDRAAEIERMLKPNDLGLITGPQALGKRLEETWLLQTLSDYNTTMENSLRLGVFMTAVQQGMSDIQAASYAKNITVNFNKKGQIGAQMGSLFAFFNANVQGTARIFETVFERTQNGVALSAVGKKIVVGGLLVGILQTFALAMAGFGDDEPPEYIKARNLVIPIPGTKKGYGLLPMPLGFNLLPNVGRAAAEAIRAGIDGRDIKPMMRLANLVGAFYGTFSPLGGTGGPIQEMLPTVADPIGAVVSNKDWTGKSISKEDQSSRDPTPGHTRTRDTASYWATFLSKAINWATDGTNYTPGALSPTPDMIDYLVEQATGGIGRELSKTSQVIQSLVTGEELPFYKVPLAGRFAGSAEGTTAIRSTFYDNVKAVNLAHREFIGRAEDRTGDAHEYLRSHPEGRLYESANSIERTIGELQKVKRDLVKEGAPRATIRMREEQITGLMKRFNDQVEVLRKGVSDQP